MGTAGSQIGGEGLREGEACNQNILGIFTFGDASIPAITRKASINTIYTVNREIFNILGLYSRACIQVSGVEGGNPTN